MSSQVTMADFLNNSPKYVVSTTLPDDLPWGPATVLRGDLATEVRQLKEQPGGDIQVPGSPGLVRQLLRLGLLDRLSLMLHPIVLGTGRRLFEDGDTAQLTLTDSRHFANGVVALTYQAGPGVDAPRSAPF
jgi:dihydrofolate reductase